MFIGHLPAGFLLTRFLQGRLRTDQYLWIGLLASVFPDIDMLYFYFADDRQTHHHAYWTHVPIFWITLGVLSIVLIKIVKHRQALAISAIIFGNIILHLILDSIVGDIAWLYPLSDKQFALFTVPAKYTFWIWSFVLHWTFLFEICVLIAAGILFSRERKRGSGGRATS